MSAKPGDNPELGAISGPPTPPSPDPDLATAQAISQADQAARPSPTQQIVAAKNQHIADACGERDRLRTENKQLQGELDRLVSDTLDPPMIPHDRTGWKPCAASVDCSSRRRGDRARSSMPQRAVRGAGSRARQRLEPPLCRPLLRRRAVNRHLHYAPTRRAWPPRALHSRPGAVLPGRTVQLLMSSDHTHDARSRIVSGPRARMPWPTASTDEFMGV
jgi:hypothetical protein